MAKSEAAKEYNRRKRKTMVGFKHWGIVPAVAPKPDPEVLRQRYAEIPQYDTRSLTGFLCGDPLPERSAYARRQAA